MKYVRWVIPLLFIAAVAALWVVNCSGPRPAVGAVRVVAPSTPGAPYRISALVRNDGSGHGQVQVTFRLRNRQTNRVYQQTESITLKADETVTAVAEFNAPAGEYVPTVDVSYPPGR